MTFKSVVVLLFVNQQIQYMLTCLTKTMTMMFNCTERTMNTILSTLASLSGQLIPYNIHMVIIYNNTF